MASDILKKDFQFPKCDKKSLGKFILSFLLPNIVFLIACYFLSAVRSLINIDYIFPCLLLAFNNKFIRITGVILYVGVILLDAFTIITQFFQFLDLAALRDFLPFVFDAPKEYIFLYSLLGVLLIILPLSAWILNKKTQKTYTFIFSIMAFIVFYLFGYMGNFKYIHKSHDSFVSDYFYIHSQSYLITDSMSSMFGRALLKPSELSEFSPNSKKLHRASVHIKQPYNDKILLIVSESLGSLKNESAQQEVFRKIDEQKNNYEFLTFGEIHFDGATIQGEIRELCNKLLHNGHDTRHFTADDFSACLPQKLSQQGYHTVAFHGAGSSMYHRKSLYPKLGFQKAIFNEHMQDKKRCHSFKGTCDSEIFSLVAQEFAQHDKALVYWLTLTSHYPYSEKDIFNHRFNCGQFNIETNSICRNIKMQTQFMDLLAELSKQPEMKGVEVLIVGDHMPPGFDGENVYQTIKFHRIAFAHFKIKE